MPLTESRRIPAESFAAQNTIFLGMLRTAGYLNKMLEKTNYYIARASPDIIRNRNPKPGERAGFQEVTASIVLLPARPAHTRTLLLLGRNLTSLTSVLISLEGLKLLDEQWSKRARKNNLTVSPWDTLPRPGLRSSARSAFSNPTASCDRQFTESACSPLPVSSPRKSPRLRFSAVRSGYCPGYSSVTPKCGSPDAREMAIEAEIYRDTILKITPVACRPIPAAFWN